LCDLGVARRFEVDESTLISETHGTYHFFSPEMTTGEKYSGFKQDIWALGLTFYILATGGLVPFMSDTQNPQELFNLIGAHQTGSLHFPPEQHVSENLKDLLNKIMDANPDTRLTIEQIRVSADSDGRSRGTLTECAAGGTITHPRLFLVCISSLRQNHPFMVEPSSPLFHDLQSLSISSPILVPSTAASPKPPK
jgi:serine/threonine protein kinase